MRAPLRPVGGPSSGCVWAWSSSRKKAEAADDSGDGGEGEGGVGGVRVEEEEAKKEDDEEAAFLCLPPAPPLAPRPEPPFREPLAPPFRPLAFGDDEDEDEEPKGNDDDDADDAEEEGEAAAPPFFFRPPAPFLGRSPRFRLGAADTVIRSRVDDSSLTAGRRLRRGGPPEPPGEGVREPQGGTRRAFLRGRYWGRQEGSGGGRGGGGQGRSR